jgi:transcriptional regulator with XRE-family HTH domain
VKAKKTTLRNPPIGETISILLRTQGLSQSSLAKKLGMQPSNLNLYLRGHKDIRAELFLELLKVLGVDIREQLVAKITTASGSRDSYGVSTADAIESLLLHFDSWERMALLQFVTKMASLGSEKKAAPQIRRLRAALQDSRAERGVR